MEVLAGSFLLLFLLLVALLSLQAAVSIGLTVTTIAVYSQSPRLRHVLPVAASYLMLTGVSFVGLLAGRVTPIEAWVLAAAYLIGDVGIAIILHKAPRRP